MDDTVASLELSFLTVVILLDSWLTYFLVTHNVYNYRLAPRDASGAVVESYQELLGSVTG